MRSTLQTMALAGVLAIGGLATTQAPARAGCGGGGGGYRSTGGYGGGHSFNAGYYGGGYGRGGGGCGAGCGMGGMAMPGMNMGGYASAPQPAPVYAPAVYPQAAPQPNGGYAGGAPAASGAAYTCPMHPNVASAMPGSCPYCHMALQRR